MGNPNALASRRLGEKELFTGQTNHINQDIDINVHGVIIGSKLALERFLPRNDGHLVNVASVAGKLGFPGGATYSASKHAVVGLSEAIRGELRGTRIDITIVMPVVVNTELGSGLQRNPGIRQLEPADVAEAIVDALRHGTVDVWVPKSVKGMSRFAALLPRRAAEAVAMDNCRRFSGPGTCSIRVTDCNR